MTTLTPTHWRALTYIKHFEARHDRMCRNSDIQAGCGLESKAVTRDVLSYLERKGLVQTITQRMNGTTVHGARSNRQATGKVGVSYE